MLITNVGAISVKKPGEFTIKSKHIKEIDINLGLAVIFPNVHRKPHHSEDFVMYITII